MLTFAPNLPAKQALRLLCIGAHSDDLEIGCAGTILEWTRRMPRMRVLWVVLAASGDREREAQRSAKALLRACKSVEIVTAQFTDGYLPNEYRKVKEFFEGLKGRMTPDLILTHRLEDRHQDHRLAAELTWNTWRNSTILEYEIPKYEGDLGQPNIYVPLSNGVARRKLAHLPRYFGTQRSRRWFTPDTFRGLMRLRGIECNASSGLAEAFHGRKICL